MMRLFFLISLLLCCSFSLSPMSQSLDPEAKIKQSQIFLENSSDKSMAVEISAKQRIQKEDGQEEMPDADDLQVFPPQLIIPAQEKRAVRIQWRPSQIESEKAYRIIAEQLPLEVEKNQQKKTGIKMLLKYIAAFYVTPSKARPKIEVLSIDIADQIVVKIKNTGSKHQLLNNARLRLENTKEKIILEGESLKGLTGENILAQSQRVFKIPRPKNVTNDMKGSLSFD
jgi:fimbrial chaperone protein